MPVPTSYANPGGTGDRTGTITVTTDVSFTDGPVSKLVNGLFTDTTSFPSATVSGKYIKFDFGTPKVITEAKYYQSGTANQGSWKWQGSNNDVDWTDIGSAFTLGGATTQTQTQLAANNTYYRYYRLLGTGSSSSPTPDVYEFEFKISTPPAYTGAGLITMTPASPAWGPKHYTGQATITLTPQATSYGSHRYRGHGLLRLIPVSPYEPVEAGTITDIPASTGGFAMGGAGVWDSETPTESGDGTEAEPTGFYMGGGAAAGDFEAISTMPPEDIVIPGGGWAFCGSDVSGGAESTVPTSEALETTGGFAFGGAGVLSQVSPDDIPSTVQEASGGFVLAGSGLTLDPGETPTTTAIVPTGGWKMGGVRAVPVEVSYPTSLDQAIVGSGGFEFGGEDSPIEESTPSSSVIESDGMVFVVGGGGLGISRMPPLVVITGDALGGFVLGGAEPSEVFEAWVLNGQSFEPSIFSAFNFNSFAQFREQAYAAGEDGIYLLGGEFDAGETIHTGARVGPANFGTDSEKRIRGVQFGKNAGKSTRVRVESDTGEGVFSPDRDDNRVVVSRDIQGNEFVVDIVDFKELSQLEITPLRLARR
jgi:hypothetical protein